jgi:hypothetical protein
MKNLHLLPTEKPSRIRLGNNKNFVIANFEQSSIRSKNDSYTNQHIYITSDEEIKEGDWLFANQGVNKIVEIKEGNYPYGSINNKGDKIFNSKHWKSKIILTTDPDLIADGVQAIDDEFLEWYVQNPSCEKVEVELDYDNGLRIVDGKNLGYYSCIIPKVEPKQETLEEDDLDSIENKIIECLNKADNKLNANDFNRLAESIIDYIDEISRNKRC